MPLFRNIQNPIADFCSVSFDAVDSDPQLTIDASFTKLLFSQYDNYAITDNGSNYSSVNNTYIVPKSGYYQVITNFRLIDSADPVVSYGQGAHTSNADNPFFLWGYSNPSRQGSINVRASFFNALDEIRMIAFAESEITFWRGSMTIIPLGS